MATQTYVLPWSCSTPTLPAPDIAKHLADANYGSYFNLLDPIADVTEMTDEERSKVQGILLTGGFIQDKIKLDGEIMDLFPNLRVIGTPSTGINHIDVEAATTRGIRVGNSPGYFMSDSVADMAFSLLLGSARNLVQGDKVSKSAEFTSKQVAKRLIKQGEDVTGATIGIIGLGNIGLAVAERAKGFKMKILHHSRTRKEEKERNLGITYCPNLEELLSESDFVVICVPLTSETKYLISSKELNLMKSTATLINVARGAIINHDDLTVALQNGVIRGVALDVTDPLPLPRDHPLLNMSNVIIIPHLGAFTKRTGKQCWQGALDNIKAGVQGHALPYPYN